LELDDRKPLHPILKCGNIIGLDPSLVAELLIWINE